MLRIPGANSAVVKCADNGAGYADALVIGENYHVISVDIDSTGQAYLDVSKDGKIVNGCRADRFVNLEPVK